MMTDEIADTSSEQAWKQADLQAKGVPETPYSAHPLSFPPVNSWIILWLQAQSCSF